MTSCKCHKFLEVIREESIESVPVQPSERAFEGVWTTQTVLQINIDDVRTSEPHHPDVRSISILQEVCSQKLTLIGKFQYSVRTMFIICKPSRRLGNTSGRYTVIQITPEFRSNAERISMKTVRTLGQAVRTHT
jgi:hypothetical protein